MSREPWLLFIHQLPPKPDYLRAKTGRRLQRIGAVTIKNTVYVLPSSEQALEDLVWTAREIRDGGGEANIVQARFVEGLSDGDVQNRFNDARNSDYAPLLEESRALLRRKKPPRQQVDELRRRAAEIARIDFFGAPDGQTLTALLDAAQERADGVKPRHKSRLSGRELQGKVWVTRAGVHIDRIASAWLIRRFIDAQARFRFVSGKSHTPKSGEIRFDMFDAEFTHQGDRCTFEVLLDTIRSSDRALRAIAEIVHDIDLKDGRFRRVEAGGVAALIDGVTLAHHEDSARIDRGGSALDDLYAWFQRNA